MPSLWLIATLVFAVADWAAVAAGRKQVRYITKPATLLALMAWFWQGGGWQGELLWFSLALIFSWLGDVFLLLPDRFFIAGLVSFLLAHVFYLVGFNLSLPSFDWRVLVFLALVAGAAWLVFPRILRGVQRSPKTRKLRGAVLVYGAVISLMFLSALLNFQRPGWPQAAALITAVGAALFFLSDSILATNRFARRIPFGEVAVIVTYHLGQIAIIWGVLLAFARLPQF